MERTAEPRSGIQHAGGLMGARGCWSGTHASMWAWHTCPCVGCEAIQCQRVYTLCNGSMRTSLRGVSLILCCARVDLRRRHAAQQQAHLLPVAGLCGAAQVAAVILQLLLGLRVLWRTIR
eukprot:245640-Chlamydomonas_euryale.AAC.1